MHRDDSRTHKILLSVLHPVLTSREKGETTALRCKRDGMCTNGIQNAQERDLMWIAMDCHSLCITSKQEKNAEEQLGKGLWPRGHILGALDR